LFAPFVTTSNRPVHLEVQGSGFGRESGRAGIDEMLRTKTVFVTT
jgi:acyl-CoA reductase-like NAD-dependent aldehyde dehydrogenase